MSLWRLHAPALSTDAICFLLTDLIGTQTAMKVVAIAMTIMIRSRAQGN